jgi:uncharacterized protein YdhG (YjbR/CyaY superfamily)
MNAKVEDYIFAKPPEFAAALAQLRAMLREILPDHIEVMSYAMPGLRAPHKGGKMIIGYAAFSKHIGLYPHSGSVIDKVNCAPFKTSKSGIMFAPDHLPPRALIAAIIAQRQRELAAGYLAAKG